MFALKSDGSKSYRPLVFILGRGERQELFGLGVLCLLKYSRLLFGIVKIQFKGGAICDHTDVFVNIFSIAFPSTPKLQCWVHILRKLLSGKGNGGYKHHMKNSKFANDVIKDIMSLHRCLSLPQFLTLAKMVRDSWTAAQEHKLVSVFFPSYVDDPNFNKWFIGGVEVVGYDAENNSCESFMTTIKGNANVHGLIKPGQNMGTMLNHEFPKMIVLLSAQRVGFSRTRAIDNDDFIFHPKGNIYKSLVDYYTDFRETLDTKVAIETVQVREWYLNTDSYLGKIILPECIRLYEDGLRGKSTHTHIDRIKYVNECARFCKVTAERKLGGGWIYSGSCAQFRSRTYCNHVCVMMYREKLKSFGIRIPTGRHKHKLKHTVLNTTPAKILYRNYDAICEGIMDINRWLVKQSNPELVSLLQISASFPNIPESKRKVAQTRDHMCSDKIPDTDLAVRSIETCLQYMNMEEPEEKDKAKLESSLIEITHSLKECLLAAKR